MELSGKVAFISGAARRLGKAITLELANAGADIALHFNKSADEAVATAELVQTRGRKVEMFQCDLANPERIAEMFDAIANKFSRIDILVNNAAVFNRTPIETLTAGQWDTEFAVNARAPALCIRYALPLMSNGAAIINIVDVGAEKARASFPAYTASKAALLGLTKSLSKALAPKIRVNAVSPGAAIWTDQTTQQEKLNVLKQIPMGRIATPEDIAHAVVFLAKHDYITGQNIRVDGGWCMG